MEPLHGRLLVAGAPVAHDRDERPRDSRSRSSSRPRRGAAPRRASRPPSPPSTRSSGLAASSRPTFGAVGSSSSLTTRRFGASDAMRPMSSGAHPDAQRGQVLDHDRQLRHGLRHAQVVAPHGVVVRPRQRRRRQHHRVRTLRPRLARVFGRAEAVTAALTVTQTGTRPSARVRTASMIADRSESETFAPSPRTPRMVMPSTPEANDEVGQRAQRIRGQALRQGGRASGRCSIRPTVDQCAAPARLSRPQSRPCLTTAASAAPRRRRWPAARRAGACTTGTSSRRTRSARGRRTLPPCSLRCWSALMP